MFMNYMDYSADECFNMFTVGQVERMDAALHTQRASLLASDGLVPAGGSPGPDLWMKDVSDDFGAEPDPSTQPMYISDDIWVRNSNDGMLNQDHQNPEYRVPPAHQTTCTSACGIADAPVQSLARCGSTGARPRRVCRGRRPSTAALHRRC
jgi:hypothetical protein